MIYREINPFLSNKAIEYLIKRNGLTSSGDRYLVHELKEELDCRMKMKAKRDEARALINVTKKNFGHSKYVENKNVFKYKGV